MLIEGTEYKGGINIEKYHLIHLEGNTVMMKRLILYYHETDDKLYSLELFLGGQLDFYLNKYVDFVFKLDEKGYARIEISNWREKINIDKTLTQIKYESGKYSIVPIDLVDTNKRDIYYGRS